MTSFSPSGANRSVSTAMKRGFCLSCPACGESRIFRGYLKVVERCRRCQQSLGHIRADDLPPYLTIFVVGHIVVPLLLLAEQKWAWSMTTQMLVWPLVTLALTLLLLRPIKGAVLGLMWALKIRGDEQH